MDQRLTLRIEEDILHNARDDARRHDPSVEHLVAVFLRPLTESGDELHPAIERLIGVLPGDADESEYQTYLGEKSLG